MSVTQPNTVLTIAEKSGCTGLTFLDSTGIYDAVTNPGGYNIPGGVQIENVTTVTLRVTMNALGTVYFEFVFTLTADTTTSSTITAATLSLNGATAVNILTSLPELVWPMQEPFDLFGEYGDVVLPTFGDDVYKIEYTVEGTVPEAFDMTAEKYVPVICAYACCVKQKIADLDVNCDCYGKEYLDAMYGQSLIYTFNYKAEKGQLTEALLALEKLRLFCGSDVGGCGC